MSYNDPPLVKRKKFLADSKLADVVFLLGKKKEMIPAYKLLLASSNPVFEKMFCNRKFKDEAEIQIPEFEAADFKNFLNYLYFDEIDFERSDPLRIYEIAHKYQADSLLNSCAENICDNLCYPNVFEIIEWLTIYENAAISQKAQEFFSKNAIGCLKYAPGFIGLSKESLMKILKLNEIRCSEVLLFENLLAWADYQLEDKEKEDNLEYKKEILKELLPLIKLKINDDLTFDPLFTPSRYNWNYHQNDFSIEKSSESTWFFTYTTGEEKQICYGFKMLLSNPDSTLEREEEFEVLLDSILKEAFNIPIRETFAVKDIYFENPIILEEKKTFTFYIIFKTAANRLVLKPKFGFNCNSNYNQNQQSILLHNLKLSLITQRNYNHNHQRQTTNSCNHGTNRSMSMLHPTLTNSNYQGVHNRNQHQTVQLNANGLKQTELKLFTETYSVELHCMFDDN